MAMGWCAEKNVIPTWDFLIRGTRLQTWPLMIGWRAIRRSNPPAPRGPPKQQKKLHLIFHNNAWEPWNWEFPPSQLLFFCKNFNFVDNKADYMSDSSNFKIGYHKHNFTTSTTTAVSNYCLVVFSVNKYKQFEEIWNTRGWISDGMSK